LFPPIVNYREFEWTSLETIINSGEISSLIWGIANANKTRIKGVGTLSREQRQAKPRRFRDRNPQPVSRQELPAPIPLPRNHRISTTEITMKLVYDVIEDGYDDTTQIRTMTEQARVPSGGWLVRTTVYTPHHISMSVTHIPGKKNKKPLFESLS
jgi:hypothetical protein